MESLSTRKGELDAAYGGTLDWFPKNEAKIIDRFDVADPNDRSDWPRQQQWLVDRMKRMDEVLRPAVLDALGNIAGEASSLPVAPLTSN